MPTKKHKTSTKAKTQKCKMSKQELQLVCKNDTHVLESFEKLLVWANEQIPDMPKNNGFPRKKKKIHF